MPKRVTVLLTASYTYDFDDDITPESEEAYWTAHPEELIRSTDMVEVNVTVAPPLEEADNGS